MRDFLDSILAIISSESLSDEEYASLASLGLETEDYVIEIYDALRDTLEDRESVSTQVDRLDYLFKAHGVDTGDASIPTPQSNILVGADLED